MERAGRRRAAAAGVVGAVVATALLAGIHTLRPAVPFPPQTIAQALVRAAPGGFATFFIERLGHWALRLALLATAAGFIAGGAALGSAGPALARRLRVGLPAAFALTLGPLYAISVVVYASDPQNVSRLVFALSALPAFALAGWFASRTHARMERATQAGVPDPARRRVVRALWLGLAALLVGVSDLGRLIFRRPNPGRLELALAQVTPAATPSPSTQDAGIAATPGISPEVTPNGSFYVVDEEIVDPDIDPATWRLRVGGHVEAPFQLTYDQLLAMPAVEQYQTLECISNPVGGDLISTAKWTGIPLRDLLARAMPRPGGVEVVFRAVDDSYADSLSLQSADRPTTLVAIGMNDHVLPREHGFPARLLIPGVYGMKMVKWLEAIEVVAAPFQGYWEQRGWSKPAVVKIMSRIDAPAPGGSSGAPITVAGVAFAGARGISRVEVSADDGSTWTPARLKQPLGTFTWTLWRAEVPVTAGDRPLSVRAYDGSGNVQTDTRAPPHPDGATGYHSERIQVVPT